MNSWGTSIFALLTAIVGVAIVAVLVSKKSATVDVFNAAGGVFISAIREAVSPITAG